MPPSHPAPSAPRPSGRPLSFAEREEIALLRAQGHGVREIARRLGRAPSTISRELRRSAATRSGSLEDRATTAPWRSERAARRPKAAKLATNDALRRCVEDRPAGRIARPDGILLDGPRTVWRRRRHGPRRARRRARAWSDLRRSRPGSGSTSPRTGRCASRTRPSTGPFASGAVVRLAARADRPPALGPGAEGSPSAGPRPRQVLRLARGRDQRPPRGGRRPGRAGALGGRPDPGPAALGHRHARGAGHALHDAAPPAARRDRARRARADRHRRARRGDGARRRGGALCHRHGDHHAARAAASVAPLGPGRRDGAA